MKIQVGAVAYDMDSRQIESYLQTVLGYPVHLISIEKLGEGFHNAGFLVVFSYGHKTGRVVMRIVRGDIGWGHDYLGDRCAVLLLQHRLIRLAPRGTCTNSYDVAALMRDGSIRSIGDSVEFLHLMEEVKESENPSYSQDLFRISETGTISDTDRIRAREISDYLSGLHSTKKTSAILYKRHIRDLIGHGEMLMGVIDTYPDPENLEFTSIEELERIETEAVRWRNKIKYLFHRCSRIHGDLHPFGNVRFTNENSMLALDLSREEFGEPADDVTGMSINYIFFSIWKHGRLIPAFRELFEVFLNRYLEKTGDTEIFKVMAPFYAFRGMVVAHPQYYPDLETRSRRKIFNFVINVLGEEMFDPAKVESYLEKEPS